MWPAVTGLGLPTLVIATSAPKKSDVNEAELLVGSGFGVVDALGVGRVRQLGAVHLHRVARDGHVALARHHAYLGVDRAGERDIEPAL